MSVEGGRSHPHRLEAAMYRIPGQAVFLTWCAKWSRSLAAPDAAPVVVGVMGRLARRRGVQIHAYCVMPDHVHAVVSVADSGGDLQLWLRYAKRESAKALQAPGLWQRSYWDRHARNDQEFEAMINYTLENPVRRGLCVVWSDWPYSWSEWHSASRGTAP